MNTVEKSLQALDYLLKNISKAEMDGIIAKINGMSAVGPTVSQYFEEFDSHYKPIFNDNSGWVIFDTPSLNTLQYPEPILMEEQLIELKNKPPYNFEFVTEQVEVYSSNNYYLAA